MRRLSLRAVLALAVPAVFVSPAALAQYASYDAGQPPAAIALFSDEFFYGEVRDIYDPFSNLNDMRFNDQTRSVAVFAGQWELCEHKDFTGRCVFITEDVDDLGWFGLQDKVSSARPIYEYTEARHGLMFTRDRYGYIRYADNEIYGYDSWSHGYASSWGISVSHYGFSPDYYRYGYYSPTWGYDPYGFAWGPRGTIRYTTTYRRHPRPSILNPYWSGWDYRRTDWRRGHWSWRGDDDHWRDHRGGRDGRDGRGGWDGRDGRDGRGGRGGDGRDWRPDDHRGDGDRDDRPPRRDVPGDRWGPGAGGSGSVTTDPSPRRDGRDGRGGRDGRDSRDGRGSGGGSWTPDTGSTTVTPVPTDPRPGRGGGGRDGRDGRGSGGGGSWTPSGGGSTAVVTPAPETPRPGRGGRGGDPGLAGGPVADSPRGGGGGGDGWRGRGRGGDDGGRGGGRSGGGSFGGDGGRGAAPAASPPPPPPPPPQESRREVSRDSGKSDSGKGGFRRRNGDD